MVYVLYGPDSFSLQQRLSEIKSGLGETELQGFNTQVLDAADLKPEQLAGMCQAMPFMTSKRLVIVEGLLSRFEIRKGASSSAQQQSEDAGPLAEKEPALSTSGKVEPAVKERPEGKKELPVFVKVARDVPESTVLIFIDGEIRKNNPLLAALSPVAKKEEFPFLKDEEIRQWIEKRAAQYGARLSTEVITDLIDLIGSNLWVLGSELEKLSLFCEGKAITRSDVKQVVGYSRENSIFQLVDAVMYRRIKTAQELLHQLLDAGVGPPHILFMITREVRRMLLAKAASAGRMLPPELAGELRLAGEKDLRIATSKARRYSEAALEELYHRILETDIQIKTGRYEAQLALELFVSGVCAQVPGTSG